MTSLHSEPAGVTSHPQRSSFDLFLFFSRVLSCADCPVGRFRACARQRRSAKNVSVNSEADQLRPRAAELVRGSSSVTRRSPVCWSLSPPNTRKTLFGARRDTTCGFSQWEGGGGAGMQTSCPFLVRSPPRAVPRRSPGTSGARTREKEPSSGTVRP